jgi:hypothetical protein
MKLSELAPGQRFIFKGSDCIYQVVELDSILRFHGFKTRHIVWQWRGPFKWPFVTQVMIYSLTTKHSYFSYGYHEVIPI